ncbi:MAG: hypothetical protein IKU82_03735 [Clostridia bacterium]|nr:hypothetical protein [Clostridia bacterium]
MNKKRIFRNTAIIVLSTLSVALAIVILVLGIFGNKILSNNKNVTVYVENQEVLAGDSIKIPIYIDKNNGLWMGIVEFNYNADVLEFVSCTTGDVFDGCEVNDTGNSVVFIVSQNDVKNTRADGVMATLNFNVKKTVEKGEYALDIDGIDTEFCTVEEPEELIKPKITDGVLTVK